jgi:hypothetical protein
LENEIIDKLAMIALKAKEKRENQEILIPEDAKKKLIFPKGQGKRTLQTYVKRMAEKARPVDYRNSGRINKTWAIPPPNYAPIASNQGVGLASRIRDSGWQESTDMAQDIISEILRFGRQTIDEIVKHLEAYDPNLITIMINALIQDDYLTIIDKDEDDGTRNTLELVEESHRNRMLESRFVARLELEHPEWRETRLLQEELPLGTSMTPIPRYIDIDREHGEIDYDLNLDLNIDALESEAEQLKQFSEMLEIIRPEDSAGEGEYEVEPEEHIIRKKKKSLKIQNTD